MPCSALDRISSALPVAACAVALIWPIEATSSSLAAANDWVRWSTSREVSSKRAVEIAVSLPWMLRLTMRSRSPDALEASRFSSLPMALESGSCAVGGATSRRPSMMASRQAIKAWSRASISASRPAGCDGSGDFPAAWARRA
ncbi:MAG: hypothetical protein ACXU9C_20375 [Xanthobacteraceae bacterium]